MIGCNCQWPSVHQRGAHEVVEVVDRAAFRTCRVHGYSVEHAKVVLNNGEYFFLCETCFPKVREPFFLDGTYVEHIA